jgi:hypothetical protein
MCLSCHHALGQGQNVSGLALLRVSFDLDEQQTTPSLEVLESNIELGSNSKIASKMQFYGFARVHEDGGGIGTDQL